MLYERSITDNGCEILYVNRDIPVESYINKIDGWLIPGLLLLLFY
jgi:hypothetical protein